MGANVGQSFAVVQDVEKPGRPAQRHACHYLHNVVNTLGEDVYRLAEYLARVDQLALQFGSDLVPLGHDVVSRDMFMLRHVQSFFELGHVVRRDDPRLVGQHVQSGRYHRQHAIHLAAIAPGEDDDGACAIAQHFVERMPGAVDVEVPMGRMDLARVEKKNAIQIIEQLGTERRVHRDPGGELGIHFFLQQRGVEMARIENDQSHQYQCNGQMKKGRKHCCPAPLV